jgi:NAD(P)-dependent dehydrogenase (short-subunit alcohol dehydrogenase family)
VAIAQRRICITGASRGIGLALARLVAARGDLPIGIARTAPEDFPGSFIEADLSEVADTDRAIEAALDLGTIDGVVNNVGMVAAAKIGAVDLDDLAAVYDLNVRVAVQLVQAFIPGMIARRWGRIVNLTSLVTLGYPERTAYGAAKAALDFCTRAWAGELAANGITVNSVAPGPTETELFRASNPVGSTGERRYLDGIPMSRFGRPEEIAAMIAFLLSADAAYITGQTHRVDGGGSLVTGGRPKQ